MAPRLTARDHQLRAVTEAAHQKNVEALLTLYGWRFFHAPDNRPGRNGAVQNIKAGYPDLTAVRGTRLLYAELKRETGKTTPDQDAWLADLAAAGAECYVWRPSDLAEIARVLAPDWTT
jgi:hypothetical protein